MFWVMFYFPDKYIISHFNLKKKPAFRGFLKVYKFRRNHVVIRDLRNPLDIANVWYGITQLFSTQTTLCLSRDSPHERSWGGTRDKPKNVCVGGYHLRKINCNDLPCFAVSSKKNMSERLGEYLLYGKTFKKATKPALTVCLMLIIFF